MDHSLYYDLVLRTTRNFLTSLLFLVEWRAFFFRLSRVSRAAAKKRSKVGRHVTTLATLIELLQKEPTASITTRIAKEEEKLDKILREKETERQRQLAKKQKELDEHPPGGEP